MADSSHPRYQAFLSHNSADKPAVEELARRAVPLKRKTRGNGGRREKDADTRVLEGDLSAAIGMAVSIDHNAAGGGELRIRYRDLDQLDRLCQQLAG